MMACSGGGVPVRYSLRQLSYCTRTGGCTTKAYHDGRFAIAALELLYEINSDRLAVKHPDEIVVASTVV